MRLSRVLAGSLAAFVVPPPVMAAQDSTKVTASWTLTKASVEPGDIVRAWLLLVPPSAGDSEGETEDGSLRVVVHAPEGSFLTPASTRGCEAPGSETPAGSTPAGAATTPLGTTSTAGSLDSETLASTLDTTLTAGTLALCVHVRKHGGGRLVAHVGSAEGVPTLAASEPLVIVDPPSSLSAILLAAIPVGIGAVGTLLIFLLQQLWGRLSKKWDKKEQQREVLHEIKLGVAAELMYNERMLRGFLDDGDDPSTLQSNGSNHVLAVAGVPDDLKSEYGRKYLRTLQKYYQAVHAYDDGYGDWESVDQTDLAAVKAVKQTLRDPARAVLSAGGGA